MKVLVTGANGFIGQSLCRTLFDNEHSVRGTFRSQEKFIGCSDYLECIAVGEIGPDTNWREALKGIDVIVHLAARAHIMNDAFSNSLVEYRKINTAGTERLATMAVKAGIRRIIYLSTIKVNGERTDGRPFAETDPPSPRDNYALSKWGAEQILCKIAYETGLEIVIIRSPLVYGLGVGGNFLRLLNWVNRGIYLPFSLVHNCRSLIYLENLVSAIIVCIKHANLTKETFLVSDDENISTPELIRMIASAMKKTPILLPIPLSLLNFFGKIIGKREEIEKLTDSLSVDSSKIRNLLGWKPPFTLEEGIEETVKWYKSL